MQVEFYGGEYSLFGPTGGDGAGDVKSLRAGAYTRPLFLAEPFLTQKHSLNTPNTPYHPLNTPEITLNCTPCHTECA
jgi:hypothetical protein